jgi:hypothetical protein
MHLRNQCYVPAGLTATTHRSVFYFDGDEFDEIHEVIEQWTSMSVISDMRSASSNSRMLRVSVFHIFTCPTSASKPSWWQVTSGTDLENLKRWLPKGVVPDPLSQIRPRQRLPKRASPSPNSSVG